jgi:hypothetical protein
VPFLHAPLPSIREKITQILEKNIKFVYYMNLEEIMNPIKFKKRLLLNKKTIVNLDNVEMKNVHGGIGLTKKWSNCMEITCRIC